MTSRARQGTSIALVLGDQLSRTSPALKAIRRGEDWVLMAEVLEESRHIPSHRQRTCLFLSAMRHHAAWLRSQGHRVRYVALDDLANTHSLPDELRRAATDLDAARVVMVEAGEHRVGASIATACAKHGLSLETLEDPHFLTTHAEFEAWAKGRKDLTMEYFYRQQRRRLNILVDDDGKPEGGDWNYDADNRKSFPASGPSPRPPRPLRFEPDAVTRDVMATIERMLPEAPGTLESFAWPVTREQALETLQDFVARRLAEFGPFEDAMWSTEPFVYHSLLSPALNLKLLDPRECVKAALDTFAKGKAPLQSVEAFIRQIIGWREYIRGIYHHEGPDYERRNFLGARGNLPPFYWTGETDMACLQRCIGEVVQHGFGHHIQRLMVTGNFALIAGVHPKAVSDWYLSMFVDAVDWVTLPNALGMVMHADGTDASPPVVGTKPYCASGQYIKRMSNYCKGCRYDPTLRTGPEACPFTTLYWDFLDRHRPVFARNHRMRTILSNLDRFDPSHLAAIRSQAVAIRVRCGISSS
ncbi:MAG: cryptochrome/photolyase family protein [Phycisphaerae bacterium]